MLIVSNFLLWVVVLLQFVAIAALGRKVKLFPAPQRTGSGLQLVHSAQADEPQGVPVLSESEAGDMTMLLHVTAGCPVGQRLLPDAEIMARAAGMRFLLARGGGHGAGAASPFAKGRSTARTAKGKEPGQVPLPHVMIIDGTGDVLAQGAAKSRPELARLLARVSGERPGIAATGA